MARRSFACACDSGEEAQLKVALPWALTGVGARSGEGGAEGGRGHGMLWVGWRWRPGGGGVGKKRRWRMRRPVGAGSWPLMKAQRKRVSVGSCCPPWVAAVEVESG